MSKKKWTVTISVITLVAGSITIGQFGFDLLGALWGALGFTSGNERSTLPGVAALPRSTIAPTATPTPTPTPLPPLDRQLEVALSVDGTSSKNLALFLVTQDSVLKGDYWTAIRAASSTPSQSEQADNLSLVVRCAIDDKQYTFAEEAANKVRYYAVRDRLKIEVIAARRWEGVSEVEPPLDSGRENMACLTSHSVDLDLPLTRS